MTLKQSSKLGTIKVNKPLSPVPITSIQQITEDASAWPTVDGVKQKNGMAYCDGSTLVNTSGDYDDFESANGSLVLPNGPFKTSEFDTSNGILTFSTTPAGWLLRSYSVYFECDENGQWYMDLHLTATFNSATTPFFEISGILTKSSNTSAFTRYVGSGYSEDESVYVDPSNNRFVMESASATTASRLHIYVPLQSKPPFLNDSTDLESYPVISLQTNTANALGLPEATATQAGVIKKNRFLTKTLTTTINDPNNQLADRADLEFSGLEVGKWYKAIIRARINNTTGDSFAIFRMNNGGIPVVSVTGLTIGTDSYYYNEGKFKATATTLLTDFFSWNAGSVLRSGATTVELEEANEISDETPPFS